MQEELRQRLKDHKQKYGTTLSFIAKNIGVHRCTISLFINNKRVLAKPVEMKLEQFLNEITN